MRMIRWHFSLGLVLWMASLLQAGDWPQWLGPNRDGSLGENVAPWKNDLKVLWKKSVSEGNSSPVVVGKSVFLHVKGKNNEQETVLAFHAETGEPIWEQTYTKKAFSPPFGAGPRSTPCVADGRVFTFGNTGVLAAWDAAKGTPLWKVDLLAEYKVPNLFFGISTSPIVEGDLVIVMVGKGTAIAAFNTKDGKLAWKAGDDAGSYSSPLVVGKGDQRQMIFLTGANLLGANTKGEILWKHPFKDSLNESSTTPVKVGDLVIGASVTAGAVGIEVKAGSSKAEVSPKWLNKDLTCYFSTPVLVGDKHLYMVTGVASLTNPTVTLRCVEVATGKEVWKQEKIGKYHAALLRCPDGNLLLHTDSGELSLLAPNTNKFERLSSSKICGDTWAHPAVANGRIYVRDGKELICVQLASK